MRYNLKRNLELKYENARPTINCLMETDSRIFHSQKLIALGIIKRITKEIEMHQEKY